MCKESEGSKSNPEDRFVRMVSNSPEPIAVLAYDWSLRDLERFCTHPKQYTIYCVDPTFNLDSLHVTVTTYRHLLIEHLKGNEKGKHPIMLGPMFIHQQKTFSPYNFFAQLVGLRRSLQDIVYIAL